MAAAKDKKIRVKRNRRSAKEIVERAKQLQANRYVLDNHLREIGDFMLPRKSDILRTTIPGSKKGMDVYDNTGMHSVELLAGYLHGFLTNPAALFFDLSSGDPLIDDDDECRKWLYDSTLKMHKVLNDSNFQTEVHEMYIDIVAFGTAPMTMEEDDKYIVNFRSWHIKNVYLDEDDTGRITDIYRFFEWTADKVVRKFGLDEVSDKIKKAFQKGDFETKFKIIHAVYPSDPESKSIHKYVSQYVEFEEAHELSDGGFNENVYLTPRWNKIPEEIYGRSPAMTALPEVKTVNEMTKTMIIAAQKKVDPPLMVPDDGFILPLKTMPAGLNYYRAGTQDKVMPVFEMVDVEFGFEAMEKHRLRIREAFYVDQLQPMGQQMPQQTATEVNARVQQSMTLLGPMLGRLQSEFLGPKVNRLYKIMDRRKMFSPMPQKLRTHGYITVQYSSLIAKAQRQVELQAYNKWLDALTPLVNADPSVKDVINGQDGARELARIVGLPVIFLRDKRDVQAMQAARAQQQQKIQQQADQQHQAEIAGKTAPVIQALNQKQPSNQGGAA